MIAAEVDIAVTPDVRGGYGANASFPTSVMMRLQVHHDIIS
jgi:hypothetical protein